MPGQTRELDPQLMEPHGANHAPSMQPTATPSDREADSRGVLLGARYHGAAAAAAHLRRGVLTPRHAFRHNKAR